MSQRADALKINNNAPFILRGKWREASDEGALPDNDSRLRLL